MGKALENRADDSGFCFGDHTLPIWELNLKNRAPDGAYSMSFEKDGFIYLHDNIKPEFMFGSIYVTVRFSSETIVAKQRIR